MTRLGILLSARGSNFVAIAHAIREGRLLDAEICIVLSNREDAAGLVAARRFGLPALAIPSRGRDRSEHDAEMIEQLRHHRVDVVCLAGYMRLLSPSFVKAFPGRILNIHPSLLPAFPGLEAPRQALEYGAKLTGCTVHFVDEELDRGVIVLQRVATVEDDDTAETLSARILEQEHIAYTDAIQRVISNEYEVSERRYRFKHKPGSDTR